MARPIHISHDPRPADVRAKIASGLRRYNRRVRAAFEATREHHLAGDSQ
jgi:hypothetical protein